MNFADTSHILGETWFLFFLILVLYTVVNIFADRGLALLNNISVGWHLLGVAVIIGLLVFVPDHHQSASFVFGERINNSGLHRRLDQQPRLLVPGAADRLPADDVHADRLRRLGAHRRGDAGRRDGGRPGRLALGLLLGGDRLVRAAGVPVRRQRRQGRQRRGRLRRARSSPPRSTPGPRSW